MRSRSQQALRLGERIPDRSSKVQPRLGPSDEICGRNPDFSRLAASQGAEYPPFFAIRQGVFCQQPGSDVASRAGRGVWRRKGAVAGLADLQFLAKTTAPEDLLAGRFKAWF